MSVPFFMKLWRNMTMLNTSVSITWEGSQAAETPLRGSNKVLEGSLSISNPLWKVKAIFKATSSHDCSSGITFYTQYMSMTGCYLLKIIIL